MYKELLDSSKIGRGFNEELNSASMTCGMKGCYVYCVDEKLAEYLKSSIGKEETNDTRNN